MKKILTSSNYEIIPLDTRTNVRFYTSVDSGSYVPPHWHDAIEIIYLFEGQLKINTEKSTQILHQDQCILIPPGEIHSTLCATLIRQLYFKFRKFLWKSLFPM